MSYYSNAPKYESSNVTTITARTPNDLFRERKEQPIGRPDGLFKVKYPETVEEEDTVALPGDIAFRVLGRNNRPGELPYAEVFLNGIPFPEDGTDPGSYIVPIGVVVNRTDLRVSTPIALAVGGVVTVTNTGMENIEPGDTIVIQLPKNTQERVNKPQRRLGSRSPLNDNVWRVETTPIKKGDFNMDFATIKKVALTYEFHCLVVVFNLIADGKDLIQVGQYMLDNQNTIQASYTEYAQAYNGLINNDASSTAFNALLKVINDVGRIISQCSTGSVVGVACSGAEPNEAFLLNWGSPAGF